MLKTNLVMGILGITSLGILLSVVSGSPKKAFYSVYSSIKSVMKPTTDKTANNAADSWENTATNAKKIEAKKAVSPNNETDQPQQVANHLNPSQTEIEGPTVSNSAGYRVAGKPQNKRQSAKMRDLNKRREMRENRLEQQRQDRLYYQTVLLPQQQQAMRESVKQYQDQQYRQEKIRLQREQNWLRRNGNNLQRDQNWLLQQQIQQRNFNR